MQCHPELQQKLCLNKVNNVIGTLWPFIDDDDDN